LFVPKAGEGEQEHLSTDPFSVGLEDEEKNALHPWEPPTVQDPLLEAIDVLVKDLDVQVAQPYDYTSQNLVIFFENKVGYFTFVFFFFNFFF